MSNMSYCRWQNTLSDLRDCAADLEERVYEDSEGEDGYEPLSTDERAAMGSLLETAAMMFEMLGIDVDIHELGKALKEVK